MACHSAARARSFVPVAAHGHGADTTVAGEHVAQAALAAAAGRTLLQCALRGPSSHGEGHADDVDSHAAADSTPVARSVQHRCDTKSCESPPWGPQWRLMQSVSPGSSDVPTGCFTWATAASSACVRAAIGAANASAAQLCTARISPTACSSPAELVALPVGLELLGLPSELLQTIVGFLPTFHDRVRACRAARTCRRLDWRLDPPRQLDEEMSAMRLGDRGASAVALTLVSPLSKGLGELSLAGNGIGDDGACAIAAALKKGAGIRRLSLRDNCIGDRGARALAEALGCNATIEEVDLWGNEIGDAGKATIERMARCDVFLELDPVHLAHASRGTVSARMRAILFEWIAQVCTGMQMPPAWGDEAPDPQDMLFRTYRHVDAYTSQQVVERDDLQLAGVACMLLASGYNSEQHLEDNLQLASWLSLVTDGTCAVADVKPMIGQVQKVLKFRLYQPTVYTFLRRFLRRTGWTEESFSLANYLVELAALDSLLLAHRPQAVAAAAAVLSRQYVARGVGVKQTPLWKAKLLRCAQVEVTSELSVCLVALASLHASKQRDADYFVNRKYSWETLHSVAQIPPNTPGDAAYYTDYMQH